MGLKSKDPTIPHLQSFLVGANWWIKERHFFKKKREWLRGLEVKVGSSIVDGYIIRSNSAIR